MENCQVAVFAAYVSERGRALVDTELHLPREFALDAARCARAGVAPERCGRVVTKGQLAATMRARALDAGMAFGYVAGGEVYGRSPDLRDAVQTAGKGYVLEVGCDYRCGMAVGEHLRVDQLKDQVPTRGWQLRSAGRGAKGLRMHAWAWVALDSSDGAEGWRRSLLNRRDRESEDEYAYFLCHHRRGVGLGELVGVAGRRWGVEECFATAKSEACRVRILPYGR